MTPPKLLSQTPSTRPGSRPPESNAASAQPLWAWIAISMPVLVFAFFWQYYAVNIPKWDDHALRAYLYFFDRETTVSGKIYQLFVQHNEHRIVLDRFVASLDYWLFGKLSYLHLMVLGNLSLVGLLAVFAFVLVRMGKSLIYALPVSLLLFNLSQWENMFWGMAALQNFSVVFWVVLTVYLLTFPNRRRLALITALLATLTSGNGLLVWPIGFMLILLHTPTANHQTKIRPLRVLTAWSAVAVAVIVLYFIGFEKPAGNPPDRGTLANLLHGWLAFTGSAAEAVSTGSPLSVSTRLGALMVLVTLGILGWSLRSHWATIGNTLNSILKPAPNALRTGVPAVTRFFWGCSAFILGTAGIVAWTRTGFGLDLIITSRYKLYSLLLLALLYVYAISCLPRRAGRWLGIASSLGSFLVAWLSYNAFLDDTIWWRHYMLTSQFNWTYGTNKPVGRLDDISKKYSTQAPAFYDADPSVLYGAGQPTIWPVAVSQTPGGFNVQDGNLTIQDRRDNRAYIVVRSSRRAYLFPTRQNQNLAGRARFWPANLFTTGFTAPIASVDLEAGIYQLFILTVSTEGQLTLYPTGQTIESAGQSAAPLQKNW